MRYENWDVLLFPESSKTPIQEFKTQCFVTRARESLHLHGPSFLNPSAYYLPHGSLGHLPVLTAFIPSLQTSSAFRVSVHSWETPRPSRLMESLMQPDDVLLFEVRVFIDGTCVSGSVVGQRTTWPHVVDLSSEIDKSGNQDCLRFPAFHHEILEQRHWEAGDMHGRIRVVISEGFSRPHRTPPFERAKDIIVFSFQHAPLHILEYSNIAWPNAAMWSQTSRLFKYNSATTYASDPKEIEDTHAHSPTKHELRPAAVGNEASNAALYNAWAYRNHPAALVQWPNRSSGLSQETFVPDPFIDPYMLDNSAARARGARSSTEDVPMPDYTGSSSASSRAFSSMTGISYEHSKQPSLVSSIDEARYSQPLEATASSKTQGLGIQLPTDMPPTMIPMARRLSAAAEARTAPYSGYGSRPSILKEISQCGSRTISESSIKSSLVTESTETVSRKPQLSPSAAVYVRGKKEGPETKESEDSENKENECSVGASATEVCTPSKVVNTGGSVQGSSRKNRSGPRTSEDAAAATPTQSLEPVADDPILQSSLEDFFDSRIHLGEAVDVVVSEID